MLPAAGAAHGAHYTRASDLPEDAKWGELCADLRAGRPASEQVVAGWQRLSAATRASHGSGLDIKSMSQALREASAFVTIFSLEAVVCVEVEQHE